MPIPNQVYNYSTSVQQFGRRQLDRTISQGMGTVFNDPTMRPTEMIGNLANAFPEEAEKYKNIPGVGAYIGAAQQATEQWNSFLPPPQITRSDGNLVDEDEMLSPQQVEYEYGHLGLRTKEPIKRSQIRYMAQLKQVERQNQEVWDAAPGTLLANTAYIGAGVVGAAMDPLNIATGFIPVGALGGKAATFMGSKLLSRVAIGGVEGLIGAAAVEPIVYHGANKLQLDYDMYDAAANLALGTILGGAAHTAGGYIKDLVTVKRARQDRAREVGDIARKAGDRTDATGSKVDPNRKLIGAPEEQKLIGAQETKLLGSPEFSERRQRAGMSPVGKGIAGNASSVATLQGKDINVKLLDHIDHKARQRSAFNFNESKGDSALDYQLRRMRMYEMSAESGDLDYLTRRDIEDAKRDFMHALERSGLDVSDIEDFKTKYKDRWDAADPANDTEVQSLIQRLKDEREAWKWSKKNPARRDGIMSLLREYGIDPNSYGVAELRTTFNGNLNMGPGKWAIRKGGVGVDDLGKLGAGRLWPADNIPDRNEILDMIDDAFRNKGNDLDVSDDIDIWQELGVSPNASDASFERAARINVGEKLRPEPDADTWNKAAAESPEDLRGLTHDEEVPPVTQHLDDEIEYSLDDIRAKDTELDRMLQELRDEGMNLDPDEFKTVWDDWIDNEEAMDEAFGVGIACVRSG